MEDGSGVEPLEEYLDESETSGEPLDSRLLLNPSNKLFFALMLFGCSFLVPWNSFLAAIDYLQIVYPSQRVEFDLSISYMLPNVVGLAIGLFVGPKFTVNARLIPGFAVYLIVLGLAPLIGISSLPYGFLILLLVLSGLSDAVAQTGGQGFAGELGLPQAIQAGLGVSGILASLLRIGTKLMLPNTREGLQTSSTIYFVSSGLVVVAGILAYVWTKRQPEVQALLAAQALQKGSAKGSFDDGDSSGAATDESSWRSRMPVNVIPVFKQTLAPLGTIFASFLITISLFPGTFFHISSTNPSLNESNWFPVINVFFWNSFDFIGKYLPRWSYFSHQRVPPRVAYIVAASRLIFFPLLLSAAKNMWKVDAIVVLIVSLFGLSNGWLGSYFISYLMYVVDLGNRETAALLGNAAIVAGLLSGSLVSLLFKTVLF